MAELTFGEAVRDGLAEAMREDPTVWTLGEDLTLAHTASGIMSYAGLIDEFGAKRVVNTPISESTIMGAAVGAAIAGTRPVADLRYVDFGLCAMDELVNQASKIRYMFGGQARVPLVTRQAIGARRGAAAQHCLSNEAWFVHIPGLVVVAPVTPADGKGLLKSAIRCDDPVVFLEHKELYLSKGEVPEGADSVPLGVARLVREGRDLTIVAWSKMVLIAEAAAKTLAAEGIEVEVIDLRTLWPWDRDMVYSSVRKTGRLLVPQEAVKIGGFAAEVAMDVIEALGPALKVPPRRIGAPRIPVPYSPPLEDQYRVTDQDVAHAARQIVNAKQ
jgi:acetoin:2,6-dichlorophenolindophenol oxidoreductase subunit beta